MDTPVLVYDDDCGFCTWWAVELAERSEIALVGFSDLDGELRERLPEDYEDCAHLVTDEEVYSCGESIEEALVRSDVGDSLRPASEFLRNFEEYNRLREWGYRWVADNRDFFGQFMSAEPPDERSDGE